MKREQLIRISLYYKGEYSKIADCIKNDAYKDNSEMQSIDISKVNAITIFDDNYPSQLLELKYPPFVLYYKGNIELLKSEKVAIVGSRNGYDKYCENATRDLCYRLNSKNIVVVSGLAKGVDAIAHTYAQKSIGVLGFGIDYIYPADNEPLFHKLETCGLLLSEYPGDSKPLAFHFPFRNRIIAALSKTLYAMHVTERSGTAIVINEALEVGRPVRILPYDAYTNNYNNKLISEGADLITNEELFGKRDETSAFDIDDSSVGNETLTISAK